jgi:hypothetical protein
MMAALTEGDIYLDYFGAVGRPDSAQEEENILEEDSAERQGIKDEQRLRGQG